MPAFYNENDPAAAAWLRELIKAGHIASGIVDERSIEDVRPAELVGFSQCHFFAGIGGWAYALRLAGWPDDRPVWTGSCPCQPYSVAGTRKGDSDARNLWPAFFNLIRQCRPVRVFGEQVASAIGHGWLDGVRADVEKEGYACGAAVLGAHSIGAPHIRQRLYWVADRVGAGLEGHAGHVAHGNEPGRLHANAARSAAEGGGHSRVPDTGSNRCGQGRKRESSTRRNGPFGNGWGDHWISCADGKARRIEPGLSPLAHGIPARVVRLRGYGNAIVPEIAAEFVEACDEMPTQAGGG